MRIGIFGGSFNPPHEGHLKLATEALSELNLDRVVFVPSGQNPLKKAKGLLPASERLARLKKMMHGRPRFSIDDRELKRSGPSFTVDTLREFQKEFGERAQLYFLAGADTLKDFKCWKSPAEILRLCRFAVFSRPGVSLKNAPTGMIQVPMDAVDISSTQIRKRAPHRTPA